MVSTFFRGLHSLFQCAIRRKQRLKERKQFSGLNSYNEFKWDLGASGTCHRRLSDLWQMREIDTLEQILVVPSCSCCRMQDSLCHVLYELHLGPYTMTITQFVRLKAAGSMLQIDRNMTQVEGSETETEPQPEPAKQTKLSLKVINLSSHRLHVKFEHQLQSRSSRGSPPSPLLPACSSSHP